MNGNDGNDEFFFLCVLCLLVSLFFRFYTCVPTGNGYENEKCKRKEKKLAFVFNGWNEKKREKKTEEEFAFSL